MPGRAFWKVRPLFFAISKDVSNFLFYNSRNSLREELWFQRGLQCSCNGIAWGVSREPFRKTAQEAITKNDLHARDSNDRPNRMGT